MSEKIENWTNEVHQGDVREKLQEMPEESMDMVITSPPYYGLRDYGEENQSIWGGDEECNHSFCETDSEYSNGGKNSEKHQIKGSENFQNIEKKTQKYCSKCGAWIGQLGLEPSPQMFVQNITEICNEIYRVLKPSGSFYLNLGDTYAGGGGVSGKPDDWEDEHNDNAYPESVPARDVGFADKCKMLIPHRVAISLIDEGWICRNDIVWSKPNPMPESVTDRRSTKFEYVFHFVKQKDYYYDLDAIREEHKTREWSKDERKKNWDNGEQQPQHVRCGNNSSGKNPGDIQEVTTANHSEAHFAVFPEELIEPHIKSSCPENGVVLDPFIGSGTTAVVAEQLDRDWIGIDLNKDYVDMSYERIDNETKKIFDDRSLFDY
jgi:DNA modification methylase